LKDDEFKLEQFLTWNATSLSLERYKAELHWSDTRSECAKIALGVADLFNIRPIGTLCVFIVLRY